MGWAIALHGGAGAILKSASAAREDETTLNECLDAGIALLSSSKSALDVAEHVVKMLEDNPRFNAGVGSVLTTKGTVEMEASIMDGNTGNCGAVSGLTTVVHPISLARLVMEKTKHVYLAFEGAEIFAREQNVETKETSYFITQENKERLERAQAAGAIVLDHTADRAQLETVGCVAVDIHGNCAAATSTGGLVNKFVGRIGDTPIIGSGTFADKRCAITATGQGEAIIKCQVAKEVAALMEHKDLSLHEAVRTVVRKLGKGNGGLVSVSSTGEVAMDFNTLGMYRACATEAGHRQIGIWKDVIDGVANSNGAVN